MWLEYEDASETQATIWLENEDDNLKQTEAKSACVE